MSTSMFNGSEILDLIELQKHLTDLTEGNIDGTVDFLQEKGYILDKKVILLRELLEAVHLRPLKINIYVELIGRIVELGADPSTFVTKLIDIILKTDDNDVPKLTAVFHLLRSLIRRIKSILPKIVDYFKKILPQCGPNTNITALFYFKALFNSEEFLHFDYEKYKKECSYSLKSYLNILNDEKILFEMTEHGSLPNTAERALQEDNDQMLIELSTQPSFEINKVSNLTFMHAEFLQARPSLVELAASLGAVRCFKFLLLNGSDINHVDDWGQNLADHAVYGGSLEILRLVEQKGFDVHRLQTAASQRRYEVFEWILETFSPSDNDIIMAISDSIYYGNFDSLRQLMNIGEELGIGINDQRFEPKPLNLAVINSQINMVEFLINIVGVDVNLRETNGSTILATAIRNNNKEIIDFLIDGGKVKEGRGIEEETELHIAAYENAYALKRLVESHKFNVNAQDIFGNTPLHIAAKKSLENFKLLYLLEETDKTIVNKKGLTFRDVACEDVARYLNK